MDSKEVSFMGCTPPVQVNATQCGSVKIEVRFIKEETREHDTLRKLSDEISRLADTVPQITGG